MGTNNAMLQRWIYAFTVIVGCCLIAVVVVSGQGTSATDPAWAYPMVTALKRVGFASTTPNQPNFQGNLNCTEITYRQIGGGDMRAGCFSTSAFGFMSPDSGEVIFNATDESIPLISFTHGEILTPWPKSAALLSFNPVNTGGSTIGLYRNVTVNFDDIRNLSGALISKQINKPPDIQLKDGNGQLLVVYADTVAFSDNASWMVVETLNGTFVRINLTTLDEVAFSPSFGAQGNPAHLKSQIAISDNGRFVAINNNAVPSLKVYDIAGCGLNAVCPSNDYWSFVSRQIDGLRSISHVRFVNKELLSFDAIYRTGTDTYLLSPTDSIQSLIPYLGTGDSYSSGDGAFNYTTGTDSPSNQCHLSLNSYPLLITQQLFSSSGHSVACSGARITDIIPSKVSSYSGQARDGIARSSRSDDSVSRLLADYSVGYLPQAEFVSHYQPAVLTVSVGGNDLNFSSIIQRCVMPHVSIHHSDSNCYATYEDRVEIKNLIDQTIPRWTSLFKELRSKSPLSRLYTIGYPLISVDNGNCAINVHLSQGELEFADEFTNYINLSISKAATAAGIQYIDISQALVGHRLCETASYSVAVNGLTAGNSGGLGAVKVLGSESYHPNALGQNLIAQFILKSTGNLKLYVPSINPQPDKLLNAPISGRPITKLVPSVNGATAVVTGSVHINIDDSEVGLPPGATYNIHLDGVAGPSLGSMRSSISGVLDGSLLLPDGTTVGDHTIDIVGQNLLGNQLHIVHSIYVIFSSTDADGDGVPNTNDSCPYAVNRGTDIDSDGVDDVCDPIIGITNPLPPSGTSSASQNDRVTGTPQHISPSVVATFSTNSTRSASAAAFLGPVTSVKPPVTATSLGLAAVQPSWSVPTSRVPPRGPEGTISRYPIRTISPLKKKVLILCWLIVILLCLVAAWRRYRHGRLFPVHMQVQKST